MSEEMDVIQHLLEIERQASEILVHAQEDADKKIAETRAQTEVEFKEKFSAFLKDLDKQDENARQVVKNQHEKDFLAFKDSLTSTKKDFDSFNSLFEKLIYA